MIMIMGLNCPPSKSRHLGPRQSGPRAQLSGSQLAVQGPNCSGPKTVWLKTVGPRGRTVRGPICPEPWLYAPILLWTFYICVCQIEWRYTQIADVCCHLSISYSNQPTSLGYIANLMHRSTHDAQSLQFRIGDAKI